MNGGARVVELSWGEAARIAYRASFLGTSGTGSRPRGAAGRADLALRRLGQVQIDTISVVERAHHHVLWSRDANYSAEVIEALEAPPRRAFEYWSHAAAYLPISDFRYCLPRMRRIAENGHDWFEADEAVVRDALARITAEGPACSSDFEGDGARGPWWDWKPAKAALEYLFMSGRLMVSGRRGFKKVYDLAERVLPSGLDTRYPSDDEMGDWYVEAAARSLGVFSERDIAYGRKDCLSGVAAAIARAAEAGKILEARVGPRSGAAAGSAKVGGAKAGLWVGAEYLEGGPKDVRPLRILSPFDPYVIDRRRTARLFGFEFTLECYVPAAKRKFGYFALPVIWKGRPIGLLDCKADRKAGVLQVRRSEFRLEAERADGSSEPIDFARMPEALASTFRDELQAFAAFNGCRSIVGSP